MLFLIVLIMQLLLPTKTGAVDTKVEIMRECCLMASASQSNEANNFQFKSNVSIIHVLNSLIQIDEIEEYLTITGVVMIQFNIQCVADVTRRLNSSTNRIEDTWMLTNTDDYWKPPLVHFSSRHDFGLQQDVHWTILVNPFQGRVTYLVSGFFTPACILSFYQFPFDTQSCTSVFQLWIPPNSVNVDNVDTLFYKGQSNFISKNVGWSLISNNETWQAKNFAGVDYLQFSQSIRILRRSEYFAVNLLLPVILLTIAQGMTFILPSNVPDRASFAITVLLSFTVIQTQIFNIIPHTPERVLMNIALQGQSVSALLVTCYTCIICAWADGYHYRAEKLIRIGYKKVRLCRLVDLTCLVLFIFCQFFFNLGIAVPMFYAV